MATANAAATPASADITTPSPPSTLSSNQPVPAPIIRSREVTESPGTSATRAAPVRSGEVMFIVRAGAVRDQNHLISPAVGHASADCGSSGPKWPRDLSGGGTPAIGDPLAK